MKLAFSHLAELLKEPCNIHEVSDLLFQLGHENQVESDNILDIEITPNRGDCLSLNGIARDLNIFLDKKNDISIYKDPIDNLDINFVNNCPSDCNLITFLEIEINKDHKNYCNYLENYFKDLNIKKVNFFTDISNYISYELGQPTHCYDLNNLDKEIVFDRCYQDTLFQSLHGETLKIEKGDNVFISDNNIINLAGIIGGDSTACSKNTTNVLVECAYFNPEQIIGKNQKYKLDSEAAYKFERGVDPLSHEFVLRRFIKIVEDHSEIISLKMREFKYKKYSPKSIKTDFSMINRTLGTNLRDEKIKNILQKLNFKVSNFIHAPSYRSDIFHINDIAEEIARAIGYDNIPTKKINLKSSSSDLDKYFFQTIKDYLIEKGFYEVINNPFTAKKTHDSIFIDNPLDINFCFLRTNLKDSLINNLKYNIRRQNDSIKFFEISNLYSQAHKQAKKLGIICTGKKDLNYINFSKNIDNDFFKALINPLMSMGDYFIDEIDYSELGIKAKGKAYYFEVELVKIIDKISLNEFRPRYRFQKYRAVSEFPSSNRDLSFAITNEAALKALIELIQLFKPSILKDKFIFDFYKNKAQQVIKIGYRFIFQSNYKTLNDDEIDKELKELIESSLKINGISIPGLKN